MSLVPFGERPTSRNWEPLVIPGPAMLSVWGWFRPDSLPQGVAITIPPELLATVGPVLPFSLLQLLQAAGLIPEQLTSVSLYGGPWQQALAWQPLANQPLPAPVVGSSTQILLAVSDAVPVQELPRPSRPSVAETVANPASVSTTPAVVSSSDASAVGLFNRVETDWKACLGLERQLSAMRQQMANVLGRLGALDRDLRPDENLAADRLDKDEWQDARRWIREAASKVHRCIKAHDVGVTSAAGRRNVIQQIHDQAAASQGTSGDLATCLHEIETYRKDLTSLFHSMTAALQGANSNGIQRAQRVLAKISSRARSKRAQDRGRS